MKDILLYLLGLPGVFVILFVLTMFYLYTQRYAKAKKSGVLLIVLVLLFSNVYVGRTLASFLIDGVEFKKVSSLTDIDMIVVPTQGVDYNGEITGWVPNQDSFKAGTIAYYLQAKLADRKVPVLICGGKMEGSNADTADSVIVKRYFTGQTAQVRKTLTETISKNLYEQAWQCANILEYHNVKNPALVTSEISMLRTLALFRSRGVEAIPFPVFINKYNAQGISLFLPSVSGLMLNRSVLKEYVELALDFLSNKLDVASLSYTENTK